MRNIIVALLLIMSSCKTNETKAKCPPIDTVRVQTYINCDSSNKVLTDSIKVLREQLFINRYKVERVKYYLNICNRNPKQSKYLKGWVRRAVH